MLPEVQQAVLGSQGAVPALERALVICSGAMPSPNHPLTMHAHLGLAASHASIGDYANAKEALRYVADVGVGSDDNEGASLPLVAVCARALSLTNLMLGDADAAEKVSPLWHLDIRV
jgi:hypothetical protein